LIRTQEQISNNGLVTKSNIGFVKMQVEVLDGSMEAPLFFYTDADGYLSRERPAGTYRITAIKVNLRVRPNCIGKQESYYRGNLYSFQASGNCLWESS
jgi:hypothetical protein